MKIESDGGESTVVESVGESKEAVARAGLSVRENVPLAPLTNLGVGGPARYFTGATDAEQVAAAADWARARSLPLFVLGGGSNIVVSDAGFSGLVLQPALAGIRRLSVSRVEAGAGVRWDDFVDYCVRHDLAGLEALSGIPGVVGGAPVQNIGAYGQEAGDAIALVRAWDLEAREVVELTRAECAFAYRRSLFNTSGAGRYVVLGIVCELTPGGAPAAGHADLDRYFARDAAPTLAGVRQAVLETRRAKSMLADPNDPDARSAGSFFRNPLLEPAEFAALEQRARALAGPDATLPRFATPDGRVKVPAAWLIERAGIDKGFTLGRAGVSSKHTLAIVNRGGATAAEILELMRLIQDRVADRFQVALQPEPVFVGFHV